MKYPRAMTAAAQALHRRWLAQDIYEMAVGIGSIAQRCNFTHADVKQVKAFMAGHCVICKLPRRAVARCDFDGLICTLTCPGYESFDNEAEVDEDA